MAKNDPFDTAKAMAAIAKQLDWDVASQMGDLTRDEHAEYLRLLGEKQLRSMDGLKLYRPREQQRLFHVSMASQRILRGGVRCLSGDTMVFDPVAGTERRLDAISGPFHVQSLNPETGLPEAAVASEPFLKSFGSLYRVTLSNGQEFSATLDHRVLTTEGWLPLRECGPRQRRSASFHLLTSSGTCQPASPQGAGRSSHTPQGCQGDCSPDRHPCGEQPQWASGIAQGLLLLQAGAREHTHLCLPAGVQGDAQECSPSYRRPSLPSMQGAVLADSRRDRGASFGSQTVSPPYSPSSHSDRDGRQSSGATGCLPRTIFASAQPASRFVADQPSGSPERGGVRLASLKYLRQGAIYDFEVLPHHNYVLAGIVHHNSGKSMSSFAETASAATTQPIIGWDGYPLPQKYPTNRPLLIWVVGYDERHIGGTIYRMLFKPGAFRIIQDLKTGEWRAWKPWELADKLREEETRPAPPLIPPRLIDPKGWAWIERARRVFATCRLLNGTEIHAFSSKSEPKKGDPVDLIHIDEDIEYSGHVAEWESRLSDHRGRMIWSVFPLSKNTALLDMSDRAEKQRDRAHPDVSEIVLKFSDNPYIDADEKRKRLEGWSDIERRARDEGEFVTDDVLVYPNFSPKVHGLPYSDDPAGDDEVTRVLRMRGWQPPDEWCRYMVLDPGHGTCACLFAAIPPPIKFGDFIVLYDEIYLHKSDASQLARAVWTKVSGKVFEAFIIDSRAGRQTPMGFSHTVQRQYSMAFEVHGIRSVRTGSEFIKGSDNKDAGINQVRDLLTIRGDGTTKLRVINVMCPNLRKEFVKYRKVVTRDEIKDETVDRDDHLMDCLRYLAAFNPQFVEPEPAKVSPSLAYRAYQDLMKPPEDPAQSRGSIIMGPAA